MYVRHVWRVLTGILFLLEVVINSLISRISCVRQRVYAHSKLKYQDNEDEDDAEGVDLIVYRDIFRNDHSESNCKYYEAGVSVAEFTPIRIVRNLALLPSHLVDEVEEDRVEVLGQQLEEEDDRH